MVWGLLWPYLFHRNQIECIIGSSTSSCYGVRTDKSLIHMYRFLLLAALLKPAVGWPMANSTLTNPSHEHVSLDQRMPKNLEVLVPGQTGGKSILQLITSRSVSPTFWKSFALGFAFAFALKFAFAFAFARSNRW